jgi:cysteine synthase A
MDKISSDALSPIGHTPLVALERLHQGPGTILAKAEFLQPRGSVEDRAALQVIRSGQGLGGMGRTV